MTERFYAYIYYDPSRGNEPFYVGKGSGNRAWRHLTRNNIHPFIQRLHLLKKNNIKPIIGIYSGFDEEMSYLLEEELISKFGRKDLGKGPLLNLTDGGDGAYGSSYKITSEHRNKITESLKGLTKSEEHRRKIGVAGKGRIPHNKGVAMSGDAKEHLSQLNLGKSVSEDIRQKIKDTLTGQPHNKVCCSVCGKLVGERSVNRYHNANCKFIDH